MGNISIHVALDEENDAHLEIEYTFKPGAREVAPSYSHGGIPADPPEIEIVKMMNGRTEIYFDDLDGNAQEKIYEAIDAQEAAAKFYGYDGDDDDG